MIVVKIEKAEAAGANVICQVVALDRTLDEKGTVLSEIQVDSWTQTWDAMLGEQAMLAQATDYYRERLESAARIEVAVKMAKAIMGSEAIAVSDVVEADAPLG